MKASHLDYGQSANPPDALWPSPASCCPRAAVQEMADVQWKCPMKLPGVIAVSMAVVLAAIQAAAQSLPLEIRQNATRYNLASTNGMPISNTNGVPLGSDGRAPVVPAPGTRSQFQSLLSWGALAKPGVSNFVNLLDPSKSYVANAETLKLPRGKVSGTNFLIMPQAAVGAPFLSRTISFLFGDVIPVPNTDEYGIDLALTNRNVNPNRLPQAPELYWAREPYTSVNHNNADYYWSPNAEVVFAVNPGSTRVVWRRSLSSTNANPPAGVGTVSYLGSPYVVWTNFYTISSSPVKPPRTMYWTERTFTDTGKPILVPSARVGGIVVVYNRNFPSNVVEEVKIAGVQPVATNSLQELRTLWLDESGGLSGGFIRSYNVEGRIFVELLGDVRSGTAREHLGFEILDVSRQPAPDDVTVELGERLTSYQDNAPDDEDLFPEPLLQTGQGFTFRFNPNGSVKPVFYANRETVNQNDLQVHWMQEGLAGLRWPFRFVRYQLVWPNDVTKYSHYIRPTAATDEEARKTAVALPSQNAPLLDYQDPLDQPRGKLTETFSYYSWLTPQYPVHRALLRFSSQGSIRFERVFSWLDQNLKTTNFAGTIAANLTSWDTNTQSFIWPPAISAPRVVKVTVNVGDRIGAPDGEPGGGNDTNYLAGYILQSAGTSFNPTAYVDPFAGGFDAANRGAIIPVNAIPGTNSLEVWWFRKNKVDLAAGFKQSFWPAVIGRYTLQWPGSPSEIVLASNDGSGALPSLQARGSIYYQNDASAVGYNPNEEHALMQGGQAYALRDDLNITNASGYSSAPFVLLSYTESDERPAMRAFKVLREKPAEGITFNYLKEAGAVLQAPMPLPLLDKPFAPSVPGRVRRSLNSELTAYNVAASARGAVGLFFSYALTTDGRHYVPRYAPMAVQDPDAVDHLYWFFPTNTTGTTLNGWASTQRPLSLQTWSGAPASNPNRWRFAANSQGTTLTAAALLYDTVAGSVWQVGITAATNGYVEVEFATTTPAAAKQANVLVSPTGAAGDNEFTGYRLASEPLVQANVTDEMRQLYAAFTFQDRKGNTWIYRGAHDSQLGSDGAPTMVMKYYYKTLPGFFFPTRAVNAQPPVGTVTPYLRDVNPDGTYIGDPVFGNANNAQDPDGNALGIVYRPVWPATVPVLQMAETLTTPKRGLPAVRGQTSFNILYQESQAAGGTVNESVVLHDPTREKQFSLGDPSDPTSTILGAIPDSVKTQTFLGKTYFPNLPPHLAERFFLDPNRGAHGALVFKGQFVDAALGDKYVFLNVLSSTDVATLKGLCTSDDAARTKWNAAIDGLSTTMETFLPNPAKPGTYTNNGPALVVSNTALARVTGSDVAVDSYALTAVGPGTGFVSLIAGDGHAFTPEGDPVSVKIIKVVNTLYRGEVNIVESSNPLNEKLTLQQVVDLAARTDDYNFEWKIAAPVDGLPPVVYQNTPSTILADGTWKHLRYPLDTDIPAAVPGTSANRLSQEVSTSVAPITRVAFTGVQSNDLNLSFSIDPAQPHLLVPGNKVTVRTADGAEIQGVVHPNTTDSQLIVVPGVRAVDVTQIVDLYERTATNQVQSIVFREFNEPPANYSEFWLSLDLDPALGARVYLDGQLAVAANTGPNDTQTSAAPARLFPLSRSYRLNNALMAGGALNADGSRKHAIVVELISGAFPDEFLTFNARIEAFASVDVTAQQWLPLDVDRYADGVRAVLGGNADVRSLSDNYLIMRYQAKRPNHASYVSDGQGGNANWSQWTTPQLAEGWIKRVLKGINPFNQRVTDLFNNSVNTDVSIVAQAGARWEGDVALNLEAINNAGLIEVYETVLNRGKLLSIGGGINYGPANDALLLAAGYLNDLYMVLGNEAWADAANPTIGIGTKDNTYGSIATALFAFRGQLPSLLEEELALLRGRDDFLLPGVELRPVYNRMVWNYTRGIDAGEVIYALNYNILDQNNDGRVDAEDARRLYPQGHGDAYGHYLTALKGYYALLLDNNFDWVPRIEAVTVLGKPVSVDYQDERKFAAAAAAVARSGKQIFDLTWRRDYKSGTSTGWSHFSATKGNTTTRSVPTTRYWGMDHWASRTGQGSYLNWVVGNAILPDQDPDPTHTGSIQQVDRTTVPELKELVAVSKSLQTAMDNAEAGHTPLGLPATTIPFDLNPNAVVGGDNVTHFEQVYSRAKGALRNALVAFDDAKDVTRLMRSEEDSRTEFKTMVDKQELAYTNALIELYGTPYPEDIGPGKTYRTDYAGPDLVHYSYIDNAELTFGSLLTPETDYPWTIDVQSFSSGWANSDLISTFNFVTLARTNEVDGTSPSSSYLAQTNLYVSYNLKSHGFFGKPKEWTGQRNSPGKIQQAISDIVKARNAAYTAFYWADAAKYDLDWAIVSYEYKKASHKKIRDYQEAIYGTELVTSTVKAATEIADKILEETKDEVDTLALITSEALPQSFIAGVAAGGDLTSAARAALKAADVGVTSVIEWSRVATFSVTRALELANDAANKSIELFGIAPEEYNQELRDATSEIRDKVYGMNNFFMTINQRLQELDDARRKYKALLAEGDRIQLERQIFRQRAAAVIQGYRTRDAAFRIFRNEKLERYKTLFDLAAQYSFMAAQAYDYETGLLHTDQGKEFINRIVHSRALGVMQNGEPQFAGSDTGDPGLSSAMAEMFADWSVVKGRLGFNNPDAYGTTVSLRTENYRILPDSNSLSNWKDILSRGLKANLLDDPDVRRYCLQIDSNNGQPVPGIVIEFNTTITPGLNLFGRPLAAGDHAFSSSSFATKIFAAGVAFEGYLGMDNPNANSGAVTSSGGTSPSDPTVTFLDPNALAATPYIYLVPMGVDSMRSPPLGDTGTVRNWSVDDVAIPLPFNIGSSDLSTAQLYQSSDSLSEPPFAIRKHQAFRPVSTASVFSPSIYTSTGGLQRSQFTSNRLIGRSVWNSKWKLVIPGTTLLNDPNEGLERFIRTVRDVKLHFVTYSYSGN